MPAHTAPSSKGQRRAGHGRVSWSMCGRIAHSQASGFLPHLQSSFEFCWVQNRVRRRGPSVTHLGARRLVNMWWHLAQSPAHPCWGGAHQASPASKTPATATGQQGKCCLVRCQALKGNSLFPAPGHRSLIQT